METKLKAKAALHPSRKQLAAHNRQIWDVVPESGVTIEDLKRPQFWAHVSMDYRPGDQIEVRAEDGSYFARLFVLDAGPGYAKVHVLENHALEVIEPGSETTLAGHSVVWSGPHTKFRVMRDEDKKVLKDGFQQKTDAITWLLSYGKAIAA